MKLKCHVCGQYNGSCNQYITRLEQAITICPTCLAWSNDETAKLARQAYKEGRLVKPEKGAKNGC